MNNDLMKNESNNNGSEGRKLFPNKAANIALGVFGGLITLALVAAIVYVYVL